MQGLSFLWEAGLLIQECAFFCGIILMLTKSMVLTAAGLTNPVPCTVTAGARLVWL